MAAVYYAARAAMVGGCVLVVGEVIMHDVPQTGGTLRARRNCETLESQKMERLLASRFTRAIAASSLVVGLIIAGAGTALADGGTQGNPGGSNPGRSNGQTLYVSNAAGHKGYGDQGKWDCRNAPYSTISAAVSAATSGQTIVVCPGAYNESVTVTGKSLNLLGQGATIAVPNSADSQGVVFMGPATAGSSLQGFTIRGAAAEAFYADGTSNLTIDSNRIVGNDLSCQSAAVAALGNDCGEGLHLDAVTNSRITNNYLTDNTGGILLTDGIPEGSTGQFAFGFYTEYAGPSSGNLIAGNTAIDNVWDCGITLPSHNSDAVSVPGGTPQPTEGGVYDNTIVNNVSIGNGTRDGGGAGILMAAPFPGTGSYDNVIKNNRVEGNGLPGITIHSHAPDQDVNGNQIIGNIVGTNALEGNPVDGGPGDVDFSALGSIGILVGSVTPVTGTVIAGNVIANNGVGVWTTDNVSGHFAHNFFANDTVSISTSNLP
jgi:hypothetical protein